MLLEAMAWIWIIANVMAFAQFGFDKLQAIQGGWRVPERYLLAACLGGGVGALAASSLFRHKTRKQPFRRQAVLLTMAHVVLFALILTQAR